MTKIMLAVLIPIIFVVVGLLYSPESFVFAGASETNIEASLNGGNEVPPVITPTTGSFKGEISADEKKLNFVLKVSKGTDKLGTPGTGAHIHCGLPGQNGPIVAFLAGPAPDGFKGKYVVKGLLKNNNIQENTCLTKIFMDISNISELLTAIQTGYVYVNVHSSTNPGGEVRGQIVIPL